jgi:hypothetical protein
MSAQVKHEHVRSRHRGLDANATACMDLIYTTVSCVFDKKNASKHIIQSALEGVIRSLRVLYMSQLTPEFRMVDKRRLRARGNRDQFSPYGRCVSSYAKRCVLRYARHVLVQV